MNSLIGLFVLLLIASLLIRSDRKNALRRGTMRYHIHRDNEVISLQLANGNCIVTVNGVEELQNLLKHTKEALLAEEEKKDFDVWCKGDTCEIQS